MKKLSVFCFFIALLTLANTCFANEKVITATDSTELSKEDMFEAFSGMYVIPRLYPNDLLQMDFYSDVGLWYGMLERENFRQPSDFAAPFLDTSLITPKAGWVASPEDWFDLQSLARNSARTAMPLANFNSNLINSGGEASLTLFYNHPTSWVDAPQLMNQLTIVALAVKAATSIDAHEMTKEFVDVFKVFNTLENASSVLSDFLTFLKVSCDLYGYVDDFDETIKNVDTQVCDQYFSNFEQMIEKVGGFSSTVKENIDANKENIDANKKFKGEIDNINDALTNFKNSGKKSKLIHELFTLLLNNAKAELKVGLVEYLIVRPLIGDNSVKVGNKNLSPNKIATKLVARDYFDDNAFIEFIKDNVKNGNAELTAIKNIFEYLHLAGNLYASIISEGSSGYAAALRESLYGILQYSLAGTYENIIKNALLKNLGVAKIASLTNTLNEGAKIAFDYMTKPNIIHFNVSREDKNFTFEHPMPEIDVIRYLDVISTCELKVESIDISPGSAGGMGGVQEYFLDEPADPNCIPSSNTFVLDFYGLSGEPEGYSNMLAGTYNVTYPTTIDPEGNHFLVKSGFGASVEMLGILKYNDDKGTLNEIIRKEGGKYFWHSHQYKSVDLPDVNPISILDRFNGEINKEQCKNNFETTYMFQTFFGEKEKDITNCIVETIEPNPLITLNLYNKNPVINDFFVSDYKKQDYKSEEEYRTEWVALDFSSAYEQKHVGGLKHETPGVYSSMAGIILGSKSSILEVQDDDKAKNTVEYFNTFHTYVLKEYPDNEKNEHKDSSLLEIGKDFNKLSVPSDFNILIKNGDNWYDFPKDGKAINLVDSACNLKSETPLYIEKESDISLRGMIRTITLPKNVSTDSSTEVFLYDDILRAWIVNLPKCDFENQVLHPKVKTLQQLLTSEKLELENLENYVISFNLDEINKSHHCEFSDNSSGYYKNSVISLCNLGVLEGYEDGTFGRTNPVSRAEFLKLAILTTGLAEKNQTSIEILKEVINNRDFDPDMFSDVKETHWASKYIQFGYEYDYIKGFSDGKFYPDVIENPTANDMSTGVITRAEAAKILTKVFSLSPDIDDPENLPEMLKQFCKLPLVNKNACINMIDTCSPVLGYEDVMGVSQWYCKYIPFVHYAGILTGVEVKDENGKMIKHFQPERTMDRAQAATAICRAYQYKYKLKHNTVDSPVNCDTQ